MTVSCLHDIILCMYYLVCTYKDTLETDKYSTYTVRSFNHTDAFYQLIGWMKLLLLKDALRILVPSTVYCGLGIHPPKICQLKEKLLKMAFKKLPPTNHNITKTVERKKNVPSFCFYEHPTTTLTTFCRITHYCDIDSSGSSAHSLN